MFSWHNYKYLANFYQYSQKILIKNFKSLEIRLSAINISKQWDAYVTYVLESLYAKLCTFPLHHRYYFKLLVIIRAYGNISFAIYESTVKYGKLEFTYDNFAYLQYFIVGNLLRKVTFSELILIFRQIDWVKWFYVFYLFIRTFFIALLTMLSLVIYMFYFFKLNFFKQLAIWFILGFFFFWIMSGFNFFLKRYRFGKFTSAIQRFWKRTNMCFWLIEGFLFLIFFYYYLNSSQEPLYMYDTSSLNNDFLFNLITYYINIIFLVLSILFLYYLLLNLNSTVYTQQLIMLIPVSIIIFYIFFIESYQFYYVLTLFKEVTWTYSSEEQLWVLENESGRLRLKHQYTLLCLVAKYWHFLFIFISWVFFLMKSFEIQSITYTLLAVNMQNLIILICLNLLFLLNWVKWLIRRYLDAVYFWFFINTNLKFTHYFLQEILNLI